METPIVSVQKFQVEKLKVEIYPSREAAGEAAARSAAETLRHLGQESGSIGVIFATGASQLSTLKALTGIPGLPWNRIRGFHMDEYVGLPEDHPASFRRYMREHLTSRVSMQEFWGVDGTAPDPVCACKEYADRLRAAHPRLCLLGIGENGHLAFNDPEVADFNDPLDMKVVNLDGVCRYQQMAEGWFKSLEEVPAHAMTLTIPTLFRVPKLVASVVGPRKAAILRRSLEDPISTACPATLLRTHPDATVYADQEAAAELDGLIAAALSKSK